MLETKTDPARIVQQNIAALRNGTVVYAMTREQRVRDNWALIFAQEIALELSSPLCVALCIDSAALRKNPKQYTFQNNAIAGLQYALGQKNIPLAILDGHPMATLQKFLHEKSCGALVTDFSPLLDDRLWQQQFGEQIGCPFFVVDSHNVVPASFASPKQEYAARTIRPKIHRHFQRFLAEPPEIIRHPFNSEFEFSEPSNYVNSGELAAQKQLDGFVQGRLDSYAEAKNRPALRGTSELSPFLHFGHISSLRVALEVQKSGACKASSDAFLEELIVRKELAENYCLYNDSYMTTDGFPEWARKTLDLHRKDERSALYSKEQFEAAETYEPIWNEAQRTLYETGFMHGYTRMYWAKKILEWSSCPEEALETAIYLNDKYALDGNDANGYTGIAWSIGGVHDRPWFGRPVFGSVRYMGTEGMKKKLRAV